MKVTLVLAVLVGVSLAEPIRTPAPTFGWIKNFGIPEAERIRKAEESNAGSRIVNGEVATLGQFKHQVGLITDLLNTNAQAVCGGSLVSANRVLTAAHCWYDGVMQGTQFTVVLGSLTLFFGGLRVQTSDVTTYATFDPLYASHDIAVIRLLENVPISDIIAPIALPAGPELSDTFQGDIAIASGYGQLGQNIGINPATQVLSWADLSVIFNSSCLQYYPFLINSTKLCVSTAQGKAVCNGDSGGPLIVDKNGRNILIGIISFFGQNGCQSGWPAGCTRITSYMDFIQNNM